GFAEVIRGHVYTLGRDFKIEQARITFAGGDPRDPYLDVSATHKTGDYTIRIKIGGSAKKPTLSMSSDPPLGDESQILGVLLTGDPNYKATDDRSSTQKAAGLLAGYAAGKLKDEISKGLPLDVLRFDVGKNTTTGQLNSRVEVGTYITDE